MELEQHGHSLTRMFALDEMSGPADLLIDDGTSLALTYQAPRLTLQLGLGLPQASGLPSLDVLCRHRSTLLTRVPIADEPSGNGQALRRQAMTALVDHVALVVSCYSRDADYFRFAEPTEPVHFERIESLRFMDSLAFVHRLNATADPRLQQLAQTPMIERLEQQCIKNADRPALSISTIASCTPTAAPSSNACNRCWFSIKAR